MMDVAEWEAELNRNDHGVDVKDESPPEDLLDIVSDDELVALYEEYEREQQQLHSQQQQQQQQDDQHWDALLDEPLDFDLPCADESCNADQMES